MIKENKSVICFFLQPFSVNSLVTPGWPIFSNLSIVIIASSFFWIPACSKIPLRIFRLFTLITAGKLNFLKTVSATANNSASARLDLTPIVSASHCQNWRTRPNLTGPSLKTGPISYLLKGSFNVGFIATNLARGTVKSNLNPKSLFP